MDVGGVEAFALAEDRAQVLEQLIPGTPDYYYYHCLHHEHLGEHTKVEELLKAWIKHHGHSPQVKEIKNRQALLAWDRDRDGAVARIRDVLRPSFDHQRQVEGRATSYPTRLDFEHLMRSFRDGAMGYSDLHRFTDRALDGLVDEDLTPDQRRKLLDRLRRPDHARLVKLILEDLDHKYSGGFGSLGIHDLLLLDQLKALAKKRPALKDEPNFVSVWLNRLRPSKDVNWKRDAGERLAYLDRLWEFARTLSPAFNSLKAHVLYHRLDHDRRAGLLDQGRLKTYLSLPRDLSYVHPDLLEQPRREGHLASLNAGYHQNTLLDAVYDDEPLVRDLLGKVLVHASDFLGLEKLIRKDYLRALRAEVKILAGEGDMEQWYEELRNPSYYQSLKERVDIEFALTNQAYFRGDEAVTLEVDVKNVQTLVVKVFAINTFNYYLSTGQEVDTSIDLDGLVAGEEHTYTYDDPPLRRIRRTFSFPDLNRPGVYVVELIGNGRSSRALVRKGSLRTVSRVGASGHVFTILDEDNNAVPEATLRLGNREYTPDEDGAIAVPFSTSPRRERVLLRHGDLTTVEQFQHRAEIYSFSAGIYVDRESLLSRQKAQVLVRPLLRMDGRPISLSLLEETALSISSSNLRGVVSTQEVSDFELFADRESVHTFQVPEDLAWISFTLNARIKQLSTGQTLDLSASRRYSVNQIDATDRVEALHLTRTAGGYVIYQLGKTGEVRADEPVTVTFSHEDYTDSYNVVLQTDGDGRIELGELPGITSLRANSRTGNIHAQWELARDGCRLPAVLHGREGETLRVPYLGRGREASRRVVSLLEKRGGGYLSDQRERAELAGGYLELSGLPAGEFDLLLKESGEALHISVTAGGDFGHWAVSPTRLLERGDPNPLHITHIEADDTGVKIEVAGKTKYTRVHVFGTRFTPAHPVFQNLGPLGLPGLQSREVTPEESDYVSGRDIGDEYRYILERKLAEKYPGNMLRRPGLLLNPWARTKTDTTVDHAADGGAYASMGAPARKPSTQSVFGAGGGGGESGGFPNLDFLSEGARVCANLQPDADGLVRIPAEALEGVSQLRVIAVDTQDTVWREIGLEEARTPHQDLRLRLGLDPDGHFTEQKQVTVLPGGETLVLEDITTSELECYDTLGRVYGVYSTLSGNAHLQTFSFVLRWPDLEPKEKCTLYSEHACHELNLFISHKDPAFFTEVVQPYLRNKRHKTFMDHYLLEDDLSAYLEPWAHGRLNVVERALLGRRIAEDRPRAARHLSDLNDLQRPNIEHRNHLFRTAIQGSALDADDALGFGEAAAAQRAVKASKMSMESKKKGGRKRRTRSRSMPPGAPPAASAPAPASDPFGGPILGGMDPFGAADEAGFDDDMMMDLCEAEEMPFEDFEEERAKEKRDDVGRRESLRQLYRKLEATQELAENDYYKLLPSQQGPDLVTINAFWRDFAAHEGTGPFLSEHLAEASRSFTEMMCALSVLDLPFKAEPPHTGYTDARLELGAREAAVVFHKEIKPAEPSTEQVPILVSQNYFKADDRTRYEGGEEYDNYVTDEFLVHQVYVCQVVLTNPTSSRHKLDLLLQIPRGALPVDNGFRTRGMHLQLESYATEDFEYSFYFPAPGVFPHYPVHVARNEALIASAPPTDLEVVLELSTVDKTSWPWISQHGEPEEVLSYLRENNIDRIDLELIAWRMRDSVDYFKQVLGLLAQRHVYNAVLWSYGIHYKDTDATREYLLHQGSFLDSSGLLLESPLVTLDPVARQRHEHLEYYPLVNARAHRLGAKLKILNDRFSAQYGRFVNLLCYRPKLTGDDLLAVAYYMFLQDRVGEGLAAFDRAGAHSVETRLQLDYMRAYAALYRGDLEGAREAARPHQDHPVDRWRKLFTAVLTQVDEALGASTKVVDEDDRSQAQAQLAATEPSFEFSVDRAKVALRYQNLKECVVNTYAMDIELLFSRQPFVEDQSGQFDFVAPNHSQTVTLEEPRGEATVALDAKYQSSNVIVEVVSAGKRQSVAHYAHSLAVQLIESYGQVQVTHSETGKPLPGVYVKVYARQHGRTVKFFKDGYTDMRGRFDYTSLSTGELDNTEKLALLVLSDDHGAVIREATPPKR